MTEERSGMIDNESALARLLNSPAMRYPALLFLDLLIASGSLLLAFNLRFDGSVPEKYGTAILQLLSVLLLSRLLANITLGLHKWSFQYAGFHDAVRLGVGALLGSALFMGICFFFEFQMPPRSVLVMEFFFSAAGMGALRFTPRFLVGWAAQRQRERSGRPQVRTLIIGAGSAGELLLRDLKRSPEHGYQVIGFVDDNRGKWGSILDGAPILGGIADLPAIVRKHAVDKILIAIPRLSPDRIRQVLSLCQDLKVRYKILPVSFAYLNDRVSASMLQDLSPEDLLARDSVGFQQEDISALVSGRRTLVTGAAGSIGSEIARQLARHGAKSVVLCDINENDMYFLFRDLREHHPEVDVYAEVVDIRDGGRLAQLMERFQPQDVFHAAAHKHVPLMESAPSEAVKNNVLGTLKVATAAHEHGADRFVLISTDKAVHPTSVMGASKRAAELVVRDLARRSKTRFTAVRFGNVLGSAGSVVPLFKKQIAAGGPVTVTHPEVRRYFMTIPEAVGLVLLAGLGGHGELCILDMGEPIRILDLARHMITMSGLVPDVDIKVEFTGLRQGEKMTEDLMTEEEEATQQVRAKIFAVRAAPPPPELLDLVEKMAKAAEKQDRAAILAAMKGLVPSFAPQDGGAGI